ncbi:hypothetical protein Patl1_03741 [Pistacia atlantica]|uniref:Uncharacterized protein n=1 Tax=Pistacia atlantica TaxID=434234 RepID=A0ACC1BV94_9ROSI|nr:hypothetical protein Patl1_03741 [Pistacia atlantica]
MAKVVDECDSVNGCDHDHDYPPPCSNDIVDGSDAVWHALGLNIEVGVVDVTVEKWLLANSHGVEMIMEKGLGTYM